MRWGLDAAEKDGTDVFLISSPAGRRLYLAHGFQKLVQEEILGSLQCAMLWKCPRD